MTTNCNGRYPEKYHEGAYSAGKALGMVLRDDLAPAVFLGADLAFRIVSQVFIDAGDSRAVSVVDGVMASFVRGYHNGKAAG